MRIWVDADACPRPIREILFRAADRVQIEVILVANQPLPLPRSRFVRQHVVGRGLDAADEYIAGEVQAGDLVVTADVPLAAAVVERGGVCLEPRGEIIDASNARARLAIRDMLDEARGAGEVTGGPRPMSDRDRRNFANALDRILSRRPR